MTVAEFKAKVYRDYKEEIDKISEESKETRPEGEWQADIGVATDMFLHKVENSEDYPELKAEIEKLREEIVG